MFCLVKRIDLRVRNPSAVHGKEKVYGSM